MENLYNIWNLFWKSYPDIKSSVSPFAKRSGLSEDAALFLMLIYEFGDTDIPIDKSVTDELCEKGLAKIDGGEYTVTGKGAILAKSFCGVLSKKL